jgi:hypothetical protein
VNVKIYIEGGGDRNSMHIRCREGFRKLIENAGFSGRMPRTKACGGRIAAFDDFITALNSAEPNDYPMLLVDSEAPVEKVGPWEHLRNQDKWLRPESVEDEQAQLMVQSMETWCIADRSALRSFFGQMLHENRLPALDNLEAVSKDEIQDALFNATRDCGRNKAYAKGKRSFELLGTLDASELKRHLPYFFRFCETLDSKL